jgi:hypothetical protein
MGARMQAIANQLSMKSNGCKSLAWTCLMAISISSMVTALYGCGTKTAPSSRLFHDENDPTHHTLAYQWGDINDREYRSYIAPLIGVTDEYLDPDNELVQRLQAWIDRFDKNLRDQHGDKLDGVPKPQARVILNPSLNAFVAPVPVCHKIGVKIVGNEDSDLTEQIFFDIGGGSFEVWPSDELRCMPVSDTRDSLEEVAAAVRNFNERAPNGCKVSLEKEGNRHIIAPGRNCQMGEDINAVRGSDQLVLLRTANWINIYAGLVTSMAENEVVGVIAHELGHYYRSHVNSPAKLYDFFYKSARETTPKRPAADSSLEVLGQEALAASATVNGLSRFKSVPKQSIHSALFMAAGQIATDNCSEGSSDDCSDSCRELADFADTTEFKRATNMFPVRSLDAAGLKVYAKFETMAADCLSGISFAPNISSNVSSEDSKGTASITWNQFRAHMISPRWPSWIEDNPQVQIAMGRWLRSVAKHLPTSAPKEPKDAAALVKTVSKFLWAKEDASVETLQKAFDSRLGHYTQEQEADEIAVEWLTEVGLDPRDAAETYLRIGEWVEAEGAKPSAALLETPAATCRKLFENDWKGSNGAFTFIAIGNFEDPHHQSCYRAFNVDREARAHKYKVTGRSGLLSAAEWKALQKIADDATVDEESLSDSQRLSDSGLLTRHEIREIKRANVPFNRLRHDHSTGVIGAGHRGCTFSPF